MRKYTWLPDTKVKHILVDNLLKFFSVASTDEWERIYVDEEVSVAFKISLARTQSPDAISAWLRKGEIQAKEIEIAAFDKKKFRTPAGVIIARLQHLKLIPFHIGNGFRQKIDLFNEGYRN